jgi:hypothetical protein
MNTTEKKLKRPLIQTWKSTWTSVKFIARICFAIVGSCTVYPGFAQGFTMQSPELPSGEPQITGDIRGARAGDWNATFKFISGSQFCTSTAIGDRVILTAAHCLRGNLQGTVQVFNTVLSLVCEVHPSYLPFNEADYTINYPGYTADFALCLASGSIGDGEILLERVSDRRALVTIVENTASKPVLTLIGYGCTTPDGTTFGSLYLGTAPISALPKGGTPDKYDFLIETSGDAATCDGDSGGAAYFIVDNQPGDTSSSSFDRRIVVGINSLGDDVQVSYTASTAEDPFIKWALEWAAKHGVKICGLHPDANHCRLSF